MSDPSTFLKVTDTFFYDAHFCFITLPCKHMVRVAGHVFVWTIFDIYEYLKGTGVEIPACIEAEFQESTRLVAKREALQKGTSPGW